MLTVLLWVLALSMTEINNCSGERNKKGEPCSAGKRKAKIFAELYAER